MIYMLLNYCNVWIFCASKIVLSIGLSCMPLISPRSSTEVVQKWLLHLTNAWSWRQQALHSMSKTTLDTFLQRFQMDCLMLRLYMLQWVFTITETWVFTITETLHVSVIVKTQVSFFSALQDSKTSSHVTFSFTFHSIISDFPCLLFRYMDLCRLLLDLSI